MGFDEYIDIRLESSFQLLELQMQMHILQNKSQIASRNTYFDSKKIVYFSFYDTKMLKR